MLKLLFLLCAGISMVGCSPKPSDSDVGRVEEQDGFKVKSFMTANCTSLDDNIKDTLRSVLKDQRINERESTTIGDRKTTIYLSSNDDKMIKVLRIDGKVTEVLLEGDKDFITSIMEKIKNPDKFTVLRLINAKKTYVSNMKAITKTVDSYIKKHKLSKNWKIDLNSDKKTVMVNNEKRIVKKGNGDYLTIIVEGKTAFVDGLREKLEDIQ
jgi:hypothetical protein